MRDCSITFPTLLELGKLEGTKLDGTNGCNREHTSKLQIRAQNDYEAIYCWLREYIDKKTTFRTYQKEAERFLLWCLHQQEKAFSSIDRQDMDAYINFLANPTPKHIWCASQGGRGKKRGSAEWRPFVGPLSLRARRTALSSLDSLFNYLVAARYLNHNPMGLMKKKLNKENSIQQHTIEVQGRILQMDEWHAILNALENMPEVSSEEKHNKQRLRFLIAILFFLGLRVHELAQHKWNAFRKIDEHWWFFVIGKGGKFAKIPVNDELLKAVIQYRLFLQKMPLPDRDEDTPLIHSFRSGEAIGERYINKLLKKLALAAAKDFTGQPDKIAKLKKFSAHWLRHLSASLQDKAGITFKHIRANLRHENDDTTRLYVHAFDDERHADSQKLKWR